MFSDIKMCFFGLLFILYILVFALAFLLQPCVGISLRSCEDLYLRVVYDYLLPLIFSGHGYPSLLQKHFEHVGTKRVLQFVSENWFKSFQVELTVVAIENFLSFLFLKIYQMMMVIETSFKSISVFVTKLSKLNVHLQLY